MGANSNSRNTASEENLDGIRMIHPLIYENIVLFKWYFALLPITWFCHLVDCLLMKATYLPAERSPNRFKMAEDFLLSK